MTIEIADTIGTAKVTVKWDVEAQAPDVSVELDVTSEVFPTVDCLKSLASATRRMATEIDKQIELLVNKGVQ